MMLYYHFKQSLHPRGSIAKQRKPHLLAWMGKPIRQGSCSSLLLGFWPMAAILRVLGRGGLQHAALVSKAQLWPMAETLDTKETKRYILKRQTMPGRFFHAISCHTCKLFAALVYLSSTNKTALTSEWLGMYWFRWQNPMLTYVYLCLLHNLYHNSSLCEQSSRGSRTGYMWKTSLLAVIFLLLTLPSV